MPVFMLIAMCDQAEQLSDELFMQAVEALDSPEEYGFDRLCGVWEKAIRRTRRRQRKAGLVPIR